jgi:hypothetical protein
VILVLPAHADKRIIEDRDDVHGRLDIKLAVAGHARTKDGKPRLLRHRITTYARWRTHLLADGSSYLQLVLDGDDDAAADVEVTIDVRRGELTARVRDLDRNESLGKARVWRPGHSSVTIAFPKRYVGGGAYRWYAESTFHRENSRHCGPVSDVAVVCRDRVPNRRGMVRHRTR